MSLLEQWNGSDKSTDGANGARGSDNQSLCNGSCQICSLARTGEELSAGWARSSRKGRDYDYRRQPFTRLQREVQYKKKINWCICISLELFSCLPSIRHLVLIFHFTVITMKQIANTLFSAFQTNVFYYADSIITSGLCIRSGSKFIEGPTCHLALW